MDQLLVGHLRRATVDLASYPTVALTIETVVELTTVTCRVTEAEEHGFTIGETTLSYFQILSGTADASSNR